jgi:hypothetical protein
MKGLTINRVCTFLIDLETKDIEDPLAQFNHTFPTKTSMLSLVDTLNNHLGTHGLDQRTLQNVFDTYWPQFKERFDYILKTVESSPEAKPRENTDILAEILENTRSLSNRISRLELAQRNKTNKEDIEKIDLLTEPNMDSLIDEILNMKAKGISETLIREKIATFDISNNDKLRLGRMIRFQKNYDNHLELSDRYTP